MTQAWAQMGKVVIRPIDKDKVLTKQPWYFGQSLLILNAITGNEQPTQVPLEHSTFWVRIHNLPFNRQSDMAVKALTGEP